MDVEKAKDVELRVLVKEFMNCWPDF